MQELEIKNQSRLYEYELTMIVFILPVVTLKQHGLYFSETDISILSFPGLSLEMTLVYLIRSSTSEA